MNSRPAAILVRAGAIVGVGAAMLILRGHVSRSGRRRALVPRAERLMTSDPICCSGTTTIDMVAQLMRHSHVDAVVVTDVEGRPIGVITDRDLVDRIVAEGKNPMAHTAEQSMTQPVVSVRLTAPIDAIVATARAHRIRQVIVVDDSGACVGMVRRADARQRHFRDRAS